MYSHLEIYPFLQPYTIRQSNHLKHDYKVALTQAIQQAVSVLTQDQCLERPMDYLAQRENLMAETLYSFYKMSTQTIAEFNLTTQNSFEVLSKNTYLLDAIIDVVYEAVLEDLPTLRDIHIAEMHKEMKFKQKIIPEKQEKLNIITHHIENTSQDSVDREEREMNKYYRNIKVTLQTEIKEGQEAVKTLGHQLELLENFEIVPEQIEETLVIFARGGYGRGEMSFSSDRDLGYCLNTHLLNPGQLELLKQMLIRIEHILNLAKIETASQYFEIDEDFSRFTKPEMIATIPSILESRVLRGSQKLSERLKQRFYEILPYEPYVLIKLNLYKNAPRAELASMNIKEDFGGLRTLQIPLWIASSTFGFFPSHTSELIARLIEKNILSRRQALELAKAMEFYYDLRNFIGAVKEYYYDGEAEAMGINHSGFKANVVDDNMEKIYLLKKRRFASVDEFDRYRLLMVNTVLKLSRMILRKILDRTVVRTFANFQVIVNLRKKRILEIHAIEGLPQIPLQLIFNNPATILDLFVFISSSDYDLSIDLKDEMANVIQTLTPDIIQAHKDEIRQRFDVLMTGKYAAKAMSIMLDIFDPISQHETYDSLLGRFIPVVNKMRYLLRNLNYHQHPVCKHTLLALQKAEEELDYLKYHYQELYTYLQPQHILALKWGIFFHDIGKVDPRTKHQTSGTVMALKALEGIGYDDEELFSLVNLLVAHHMTVVALSKTAAYFDQALLQFFEVAERDMVKGILLFLVNIADYSAVSDLTATDTKQLRTFFDETYRLFSEMRFVSDNQNPIVVINTYLDKKKRDLEFDTRIDLLINSSLQKDLNDVLYEPLKQINKQEYDRLVQARVEIHKYWRYLKMGNLDAQGTDQYTDKLIRTISQFVSNTSIEELTSAFNERLNWFFRVFPNRFLLGKPPSLIAKQLMEFHNFEERPIIVSVLTSPKSRVTGLLIWIHQDQHTHSRVAYALSQRNINIESGKMNKVMLQDGKKAYCYYFKVSELRSGIVFPRDLEKVIMETNLPEIKVKNTRLNYRTTLKLEYLDSDNKGYSVIRTETGYERIKEDFRVVKITVRDAPLVYYKMTEAFDRVNVNIQQSLITTTGHQVADYFYINPDDYERLKHSNFEEILKLRFWQETEI